MSFWLWIMAAYAAGALSGFGLIWLAWALALREADRIDTEAEKEFDDNASAHAASISIDDWRSALIGTEEEKP